MTPKLNLQQQNKQSELSQIRSIIQNIMKSLEKDNLSISLSVVFKLFQKEKNIKYKTQYKSIFWITGDELKELINAEILIYKEKEDKSIIDDTDLFSQELILNIPCYNLSTNQIIETWKELKNLVKEIDEIWKSVYISLNRFLTLYDGSYENLDAVMSFKISELQKMWYIESYISYLKEKENYWDLNILKQLIWISTEKIKLMFELWYIRARMLNNSYLDFIKETIPEFVSSIQNTQEQKDLDKKELVSILKNAKKETNEKIEKFQNKYRYVNLWEKLIQDINEEYEKTKNLIYWKGKDSYWKESYYGIYKHIFQEWIFSYEMKFKTITVYVNSHMKKWYTFDWQKIWSILLVD